MNRITPEMVIEAYRKTGLNPVRGDYFPITGYACALGALYVAEGKYNKEHNSYLNSDSCMWHFKNAYGVFYQCGFVDAFDGAHMLWPENDEYVVGYEDGRAAWNACVEAGLVKE
jgi:hypothetical protein